MKARARIAGPGAVVAVVAGVAVVLAGRPAPASATDVGTEAALRAAFADPAETLITLTTDISLTDCVAGDLERNSSTALVLDGGGHQIAMQSCPGPRMLTNTGSGALSVVQATLTGASATVDGGAVYSSGPLSLEACAFTGNSSDGHGGAIYAAGALTIDGCEFADNSAGPVNGLDGSGGAIFAAGDMTIAASTLHGNTSRGLGGAVYAVNLATVSDTSMTDNVARLSGGGLGADRADITSSEFLDNTALNSAGGAVAMSDELISVGSTYAGNQGAFGGGAISALPGNGDNGGRVVLHNSTVTGNSASRGGGVSAVSIELRHTTVVGNSAQEGANLDFQPPYVVDGDHEFVSFGSVVAVPLVSANCFEVTAWTVAVSSAGFNFSDDASCRLTEGTDTEDGGDPLLAVLGDNGGPTPTRLPVAGSPLIDAIPAASCATDADQRGVARPAGIACDIGAVDVASAVPVATDDTVSVAEDSAATRIDVLANDTDADPDAAHSTLTVAGTDDGSGGGMVAIVEAGGAVTYQPPPDFAGVAVFTYRVTDPQGNVDVGTVTVVVTQVADPPVAADGTLSTGEDQAVTGTIDIRDADGDPLAFGLIVPPSHGSVDLAPDGTFTYIPATDTNGTDSFQVSGCDAAGSCATATVTVTVAPVDDPPVAADDAVTVVAGQTVSFDPLANDRDVDGDPLTARIVTGPSFGTATCTATGCTYTAAAGFSGTDQFLYVADAGPSASAFALQNPGDPEPSVATVTITVTPAAVPPTTEPTTTATVPTAGELPVTGSRTSSTLWWAIVLLATGGGLLATAARGRRRRLNRSRG